MGVYASLAQPLSAQIASGADAVLFNRYDSALRSNLWEDGTNPVGIRQDTSFSSIAHAELHGSLSAGGFRQSHEASLPWSVGAKAESLVHLKKFSMQGSFSFEQMQGADMCGSIFVNPGYYPVNAYEFTPGKKIRQTYAFDGAISVDVADNWRVGAGIDFTSANLSKRKDVRHSNYLLDMTVSPGVIWHVDNLALGLDAILRKTNDTPTAKQIGTKETYQAFLDKGLHYGRMENWDGSGLHLSESGVNGFPVKEIFGGVGVQAKYRNMFIDLSYLRGNGTIGEKQFIWYRFPSHNFGVNYGYRWNQRANVHAVRVNVDWKRMENHEAVLDKVNEGGVTTTVKHGENLIFTKQEVGLRTEYAFAGGGNEVVVRAGVDECLGVASQMYPYVVEQTLAQFMGAVGYTRHMGKLDIAAGVGYRGGSVLENEKVVSEDSGVTSEMTRLEDYYLMDMEYKTAHRMNLGVTATYNFWKSMYAEVMVDYTRAFKASALPGANRVGATLKLGYNF